jgi:hypothetical protein
MRPVAETYKFIAKLPEAQFIVPDWENKVDYDIGLSYRSGTTTLCHGRL